MLTWNVYGTKNQIDNVTGGWPLGTEIAKLQVPTRMATARVWLLVPETDLISGPRASRRAVVHIRYGQTLSLPRFAAL